MSKTETLSIDLLRLDGDTQARIEVHADTVDEYAELITLSKTKWPFPPLTVYHDGTSYFPADGFHRVLAAVKAGRASIPCDVKKGTARDARFFGMKANDQHGLRMSREDRRKNVVWMLDNYAEMTQANIAENAGVSLRTVGLIVADRKPKNAQIAHSLASKPKPEPAAPTGQSLEFTEDLDADGDPVWLTPVEDDDEDTPEPPKVTPEKPEASIMLDSLGRQIPKNLRSASELAILLVATGRELDKFRKAAKDFAEQPGGDWLRVQDISDGIKVLKDHFQQAAYHTACLKCGGKGCKVCEMTGWIPEYLKGTL